MIKKTIRQLPDHGLGGHHFYRVDYHFLGILIYRKDDYVWDTHLPHAYL